MPREEHPGEDPKIGLQPGLQVLAILTGGSRISRLPKSDAFPGVHDAS